LARARVVTRPRAHRDTETHTEAQTSATMASTQGWAVVGVFVVMVISNVLSQKKVFGGKDNKQISDDNPTYVSPDGPTFAVWGFIYLLEIVLVIAQLFASQGMEVLLARTCPLTGLNVRERLMMAFLANSVWLPIFNNERFWAALVVMFVYLAFLVSTYRDLNVANTSGIAEAVMFTSGVAMNTSWIVVASLVNTFLCLGHVGWLDQYGVAGSVPIAILAAVLVSLLAIQRTWVGGDLAWAFVASWALRGIYRMQTIPDKVRFPLGAMNPSLAETARWCSFVVAGSLCARAAFDVYRQFASSKAPGYQGIS